MNFQFHAVSKCLAGLFEVIIRLEIHPALGKGYRDYVKLPFSAPINPFSNLLTEAAMVSSRWLSSTER
jgi:hypothetical protein